MSCFRKTPHTLHFGTILLIVEGEKTEFELFVKIFSEIFGCTVIKRSREDEKKAIKSFIELQSPKKENANNTTIIVNTDNSNIDTINGFTARKELIYKELLENYGMNPYSHHIYYIWDRDRNSNRYGITRALLARLTSPEAVTKSASADTEYEGGLLLLSYPAIEAYLESLQREVSGEYQVRYSEQKKKELQRIIAKISMKNLELANANMIRALKNIGIRNYNVASFGKDNISIFDEETKLFASNRERGFYKLSLISIMLQLTGVLDKS